MQQGLKCRKNEAGNRLSKKQYMEEDLLALVESTKSLFQTIYLFSAWVTNAIISFKVDLILRATILDIQMS